MDEKKTSANEKIRSLATVSVSIIDVATVSLGDCLICGNGNPCTCYSGGK